MRDNIYNVRSGVAPVISSLIITAAVLSIGSMIWSFSLGAATVTADIYVNDTLDMLNEMKERFNVENAYYDTTVDELRIWVFNYGEVDIKEPSMVLLTLILVYYQKALLLRLVTQFGWISILV